MGSGNRRTHVHRLVGAGGYRRGGREGHAARPVQIREADGTIVDEGKLEVL